MKLPPEEKVKTEIEVIGIPSGDRGSRQGITHRDVDTPDLLRNGVQHRDQQMFIGLPR